MAFGRPGVNRRNLFLEYGIDQSMPSQGRLLSKLRGDYDRLEHLPTSA